MSPKKNVLTRSLFVFHAACSTCNNCDIELLAALTPRYDLERFGIVLVGSPRHADVLLVTGAINKKVESRLRTLYEQTAKPCFVVAVGGCASSEILFRDSYNTCGPADKIIPVDVYVPGCPPRPQAIISGIMKLVEKVNKKSS